MRNSLLLILLLLFCLDLSAQNEIVDTTFGSKGFITTVFPYFGIAKCSLITPGDTIIQAGMAAINEYHNHSFAISRHLPGGNPDSSFGDLGKVVSEYGNLQPNDAVTNLAIQQDGYILAGGYINNLFGIARYAPDGNLDQGFGDKGFVTTFFTLPHEDNQLQSIAIQPDGRIVAVGFVSNLLSQASQAALARYNVDGTLDPSFDFDGKVITDFNGTQRSGVFALTLLPDGKILVAGVDGIHTILARYLSDGSLEWVKNVVGVNNVITMLRDDDKVILIGQENDSIEMTRLFTDGTVDSTFGNNGIQSNVFSGKWDSSYLKSATLAGDGKILASGNRLKMKGTGFTWDVVVYCFNADGTPDMNFGTDGAALVAIDGKYFWSEAIGVQSSGRIIITGYSGLSYDDYAFTTVRCLRKLVLNLNDFISKENILFYPNPVRTEEYLEYFLDKDEEVSVQLFNLKGNIIRTFLLKEKQGPGKHGQPLVFPSDLMKGLYFLKVTVSGRTTSIKIIKDS